VLTRVVEERGCGILLVEHDMSLVMSVCSYLYVLDFGRLVFEGTSAEVASSDIVRAAYLGSEAVTAGNADDDVRTDQPVGAVTSAAESTGEIQ
jgi:ABC-type methionine transport system ATPase subunit